MTAPISRPDRLYQSVVGYILERIAAERLQPGHPLPTERELVADLGVSRNVLREAFRVLEERGLIVTRQGSGRYVRKLPTQGKTRHSSDLDQLERASIADTLEARLLLEDAVIVLACQRRTTRDAQHIFRMAERFETWKDNIDFHVAIARSTHNFMLERLVRELLVVLDELHQRDHYSSAYAAEFLLGEHADMAAAILERDIELARELLRKHLLHTTVSVSGSLDRAASPETPTDDGNGADASGVIALPEPAASESALGSRVKGTPCPS